MDSTFIKGRQGEDLACRFLQEKGYTILARNYVYKKHEVDIIAEDKNEIVFIEVKQRDTNVFGEPYEAVTLQKQRFIINVANHYIQHFRVDLEARFDIISITALPFQAPKIEHLENAFTPQLF